VPFDPLIFSLVPNLLAHHHMLPPLPLSFTHFMLYLLSSILFKYFYLLIVRLTFLHSTILLELKLLQ
jgi:hypothetical protein